MLRDAKEKCKKINFNCRSSSVFIVGLGSYDPRKGKKFQLVSSRFALEIMCV